MSLDLDSRRRAMLGEMGIRLFEPVERTPAVAAPVPRVLKAAPAAGQEASPRPVPASVPLAVPLVTRAAPADAGGIGQMEWDALADAVAGCRACGLCEGRRNTVFGVGDRQADWLVVGEAPGENEDLQGEPFVGQAGKLLDNMLKALGLDRQRKVYIANVLKCRPPGNRDPQPVEIESCEPYLARQVQLIEPRVVCTLGNFATKLLTGSRTGITKVRGTPQVHRLGGRTVFVMPLFHPAAALRTPSVQDTLRSDFATLPELLEQPLPDGDPIAIGDAAEIEAVEVDQLGLFG